MTDHHPSGEKETFYAAWITGSLLTALYVLRRIRKSKMSMENSVFWILFSAVLVLLGIFPDIAVWFASLLQVQSTVNLVYLVIIFLLLVKVFVQDQRISRLESQTTRMAQTYALDRTEEKEINTKSIEKNS